MMFPTGFRKYVTINYTTPGQSQDIDPHGSAVYIEVTNAGGSDITFYPNIYPDQGLAPGAGIPVKAGTTRVIPMMVLNFQATGNCTVVAYMM